MASQAENELGRIVSRRMQVEMEINKKLEYIDDLNKSDREASSVRDYQILWHHKNYIRGEIKELRKQREQLLEIENIRRKKLIEAMKHQKALEKLKEKKKSTHRKLADREENAFLDELSLKRHGKSDNILSE
jgi:flagellar export protein FliJ